MLIKMQKAQSTLEYALLVAVVVGALLTIQNYMKRGVQGSLRDSTDEVSDKQYSPDVSEITITSNQTTQERVDIGDLRTTTTTGSQTVSENRVNPPLSEESWPAQWE